MTSGLAGRAPWWGLHGLLAILVRAVAATWRYTLVDRSLLDEALAAGGAVLALWHGQQLPLLPPHAALRPYVLVSRSPDGEHLARTLLHFGIPSVRGSSSRGGAEALEAARRLVRGGAAVVFALDGPRGPREVPHAGAVACAATTGRPIVYAVARVRPAIRLPSWDRFEIPLPFARIVVRYGRFDPPRLADVEEATANLGRALRSLS